MPELRQNYFTKEWVIIATERAKRPEDLAMHRPAKVVPPFVETCPHLRLQTNLRSCHSEERSDKESRFPRRPEEPRSLAMLGMPI